jgi:tartrate-resistant acid phosphatase type 5
MKKLVLACILAGTSGMASAQSFAAFGDYGVQSGASAVATFVKSKNPDHILSLGDQCYDATPTIARQVGDKYGSYVSAKRFWPTLGNHEYSDGCGGGAAKGYFSYFALPNNERYYDVVLGNVHLFVLNANTGSREPSGTSPTSVQGQWLKNKLAASKSPWKIVMFHQPPFSSGEHGNATYMQWPFEAWGATAVLSGHDHNYERFMKDANKDGVKMPYFVAGLGGAERRPFAVIKADSISRYKDQFGALFLTATSTSLSFKFLNIRGTQVDSLTLTKPSRTLSTSDFKECC